MKLLQTADLLDALEKRLKVCERLDLAVAYCCSGPALDLVIRYSAVVKVRALIGISDMISMPAAIEALANCGNAQVQLVSQSVGKFHPKAFLFRGVKGCAWVGSANLTNPAFSTNTELVFESLQIADLATWFNSQWSPPSPTELKSQLKQYRKDYEIKRNSERKRRQSIPRTPIRTAHPEFSANLTWKGFVSRLVAADAYWSSRYTWSVLGESFSYLETIATGHTATLGDWSRMNRDGAAVLISRGVGAQSGSWALLGSCGKTRTCARFQRSASYRNRVWAALQPSFKANRRSFPQVAERVLSDLDAIPGISFGVGTRLLALARPDLAVSVNAASRDGLAAASGLSPTTLNRPKNYRLLLEWLLEQPFMAPLTPESPVEKQIWPYRAALIDALVYQPLGE